MKNTQESLALPRQIDNQDNYISNPKIAKLREILIAHFGRRIESETTESDSYYTKSRVIVFVAYRATAADIVRELSNTTGNYPISCHLIA